MRLPQLSLLPRIALSLALVGFLPLLLTATLLIRNSQTSMVTTIKETQVVWARTAAARVDELLRARLSVARSVANNPALARDPRSDVSTALIRGLFESLDDLLGVEIRRTNGDLVVALQRPGGEGEEALQQARSIQSGDQIAGSRDGDRTVLRFLLPIPGTDGQLTLVTNASALAPAFVREQLREDAEIGLFDADHHRLLGSIDVTTLPPEVRQTIQDNHEKTLTQGLLLLDSMTESDELVPAYAATEVTPWYVVAQQPSSVVFATTRRMAANAGLAIGLASLLIIGLSSAAYSSVVRPIRDLTRSQRELLGSSQQSTGNEIEDLKQAFQQLERRVKDRHALEETFLGRYQVHDVLGEGAMGMVFRGWDPRLERPVALKTIRLDREVAEADREHLAERLVQEAITTARLTDANVVSVFDVQSAGDMAFIAMELVTGHSLADYLRMRGTLRDTEAARIGLGIARGLSAAHRHGILHQDIKPANILLGDDGQIKVTDFGIANLVTALVEEEDLVFGTPGYLPPEALDGNGFDEQGDLFALGVVLFQSLTGKAPFAARSLSETIRKTLDGDVPSIRAQYPDVSEELEQIIGRLLAKNKNERITSAAEAAAQLEPLVPADGGAWKPRFASTGPDWEDFLDARPKSRLLRSSRISELAGTSVL